VNDSPRNKILSVPDSGGRRRAGIWSKPLYPTDVKDEERFAQLLRWRGVSMPPGAWVRAAGMLLEPSEYDLCTTEEGHAAAKELFQTSTLGNSLPQMKITPWLLIGSAGQPLPPAAAADGIRSFEQIQDWLRPSLAHRNPGPGTTPESEIRFILTAPLHDGAAESAVIQADIRGWNAGGGALLLQGFCGAPPGPSVPPGPAASSRSLVTEPIPETEIDLEFELTIRPEEYAVLQLGNLADGRPCALVLKAAVEEVFKSRAIPGSNPWLFAPDSKQFSPDGEQFAPDGEQFSPR
jgi:hypothetical protein